MAKSTFFTGQPVFTQLLSLIPSSDFNVIVKSEGADYRYKKFLSYEHLVTMLYASFYKCLSLREVITGLHANYNKLSHLGLRHLPKRSTLAEANAKRDAAVFEKLYHQLYLQYFKRIPDSSKKQRKEDRMFILDSTTITLFSDVMKGAGSYGSDGRKKGGAKAHVLLDAKHNVPSLIWLSSSSQNDRNVMSKVKLEAGSILIMDKGYHKFSQWQEWTESGIHWVCPLIESEAVEILENREITDQQRRAGVRKDQRIILGAGTNVGTRKIEVRLITYYDSATKRSFKFLTNNFRFRATTIAAFYESRWQIETFFKSVKQSRQLRFFLGETENAIKIQIWCAFIADLLIKIVKSKLKRNWSFSNLSALVRHHLMNYLNLISFLNDPDKLSATPRKLQYTIPFLQSPP